MKRLLSLSILAGFLLAIPVSHLLMGKGHVPAHKTQVCHDGIVNVVGTPAVAAHLSHGDITLPGTDFCCVYMVGEACDSAMPCPHNAIEPQCSG